MVHESYKNFQSVLKLCQGPTRNTKKSTTDVKIPTVGVDVKIPISKKKGPSRKMIIFSKIGVSMSLILIGNFVDL